MLKKNLVRIEGHDDAVSFLRTTHEGTKEWETYFLDIGTRRGLLRAILTMTKELWITPAHIQELVELAQVNPKKTV